MLLDIRTVATPETGSLSFLEGSHDLPFEIKRVTYLYEAPKSGKYRGHAHRKFSQLFVCTYGAIEILIDANDGRKAIVLDDPSKGLLVENFTLRGMRWLKEGSVLMVAEPDCYDEDGRIRNRADFKPEAYGFSEHIAGGGYLGNIKGVDGGHAIEGVFDVPFDIKRTYYIYDVPKGAVRGGHAHRNLEQLLVCTYGSIEILLDDGVTRGSIVLDHPQKGLLVNSMVWHDMRWIEDRSVLSVLASGYYDEKDYIRDYGTFKCEVAAIEKEI